MPVTLTQSTTDNEFIAQSVAWITTQINAAIDEHGSCIIGLSGGKTPCDVYTALGKEDLDWSRVHIYLTDERYIAATHADSNQKMIRDTLLANATIPESNIVFPDTSLPLEDCIDDYAMRLQVQWADYLPDVCILGIGHDGHITSLFPPLSDNALGDEQLVIHTTTEKFAVRDRISLSLNAVTVASAQLMLMKGAEKKAIWEEMMNSDEDERHWPMKRVIETGDVTAIVL